MDLITELPPSYVGKAVFTWILVVVDRLTKMAHYIPVRHDLNSADLGQVLLREIVRQHEVPDELITDRDV